MSTAQNNIVREVAPKSLFESARWVIDSTVSFNQGDLLAFDTGSSVLKAAATGDIDNLLGVAPVTIEDGKVPSPYQGTAVDASQAISDIKGPVYGVVAFFTLKTGDAFNPGDKVYLTADPQTVTVTDPSSGEKNCGIYVGKAVASASAGQTGDVMVGARFSMSGISY